MYVKKKLKEIISKEDLVRSNEDSMDIILRIIFDNSKGLELEGSEKEKCIKARIEGLEEWLYLRKISEEKYFVYTSEENKDRCSAVKEHKNPFIWGKLTIYDFRNFFEIYIESSFDEVKKTG